MEKLQPLITHRFWVLFGLALIVPLVSWALDNSAKVKAIDDREAAIDADFKKAKQGGDAPNQNWVKDASKENTQHQEALTRAAGQLLENQQKGTTRFWPEQMKPYVKNLKFGQEHPNQSESGEAFIIYRNEYDTHFAARVLSQISTYENKRGLCDVAVPEIHKHSIGPKPTWAEVWHAQEDAWLVAQLLKSLNKVNKDAGAVTIAEAPIRQLHYLRLLGGNLDENAKKGGSSGDSYSSEGPGRRGPSMGGGGSSAGGLSDMGGGKKKGSSKPGSGMVSAPAIEFDEVEEFGSPVGKKKKSGLGAPPRGGSSATGSSSSTETRRYVNNKDEHPYKTRGFKLKLTIQQDSLPKVLAELTNSDWPVEIVRVHWEAANDFGREAAPVGDDSGLGGGGGGTGTQSGGGFGGGGFGGGGFGGGGFGGGDSGESSSGGSSDGGSFAGGGDESAYREKEQQQQSSSSNSSSYPGAGGGSGLAGGGGPSAGAGTPSSKEPPKDPLEAALRDPYLANVVIAGLITIFKEDEKADTKVEGSVPTPQDSATAEQPADTATEADNAGTAAAAGENAQEKTEPEASESSDANDTAAKPEEKAPAETDETTEAPTKPADEKPAESGAESTGEKPAEKPASGESAQ